MFEWIQPNIALPSVILIAGLIDDVRSRKVHNKLILVLTAVAGGGNLLFYGSDGLTYGLAGALVALVLCLPLVIAKALGAGDMKLLMAFGLATNPANVFWVLVYSIFWGGVLGLIRAALDRNLGPLFKNAFQAIKGKKLDPEKTTRIPFAVAMFFGWLGHLTLTDFKGSISWLGM